MNWEDERYFRFYTRDTPEWTLLSWEARGLFGLLGRAVDRAGVIDMGKPGAKALASLFRCPVEVVERVLAEWIEDGCVERHGNVLVIPNYIQAQTARQSDKARQEESRSRRSALARLVSVTNRDEVSQNVTERHEPSQDVTAGHTASHCAVLSCTVLNCTDHDHAAQAPPPSPNKTKSRKNQSSKTPKEPDQRHAPLVKAMVEAFEQKTGQKYDFGGGDAKAVSSLLSKSDGDIDEVLRRWGRSIDLAPKWPGTLSIITFASKWNEFAVVPAQNQNSTGPPRPARDWSKGRVGAEEFKKSDYEPGEVHGL